MPETVNLDVTTLEESVTVTTTDGGTVEVAVQAEKGDAATVTIGTTTTGNAGTNASVTNSGTTSAAVFNFTIPRGDTGAAGPNTVTSATTSDGTANLSISNVTTATATVTGTLNADHIHGNLAGSVYAHVRAGENLAKGDPVYISGSHGSGASLIAIVSKADASNAAKMPAVGVMDAAVTNNASGHMVITGTITELDTNAYAVNAELYVAVGGGFTSTPPESLCQPVARVERSNTNNGAVIVKVNGLSSKSAIDNTLVRRGVNGDVSFAASTNDTTTLSAENNGSFAGVSYPTALKGQSYGSNGIGVQAYSDSGWGAVIVSNTNTGAVISTNSGTYHAEFSASGDRSAIERVRGWFVWFYNTFTGRLKTADITANRDWTLPDASGTIALTSNIPTLGTNVATFLATPSSANLAAAVTDETGTGSLVFASFVGDMGRIGNSAEVSITGGTTLSSTAFGAMHVCSGTAADYTVNLPSPTGNATRMIAFRMSSALTRFVTISTPSGLIDGLATRIMWANETCVLYCDGTNWTKASGRSIPLFASGENAAGVSCSNATVTPITLSTNIRDNSTRMVDTVTSTSVFRIRRAGNYNISAMVSYERAGSFAGFEAYAMVLVNSLSANATSPSMLSVTPTNTNTAATTTFGHVQLANIRQLALSDYVALAGFQSTGGTMTTRTINVVRPYLSIIESPTW